MTSPVNVAFDLAGAETKIIPMNRWGYPAYGIGVKTGSALVEGTLDKVNRVPAIDVVWFTLNDEAGAPLAAVTGGIVDIQETPLEAMRITATGATSGNVMQTGGS
ncbi:unnamed protein product [marine sediment metagenome]|uniref:Uncharacterized protein n=1 Tax=marine sediment metagenome TaxID=412755 RepID=X1AF52_9ZZZZ